MIKSLVKYKVIVSALIVSLILSGCSEYNKILNSTNYELKYDKAIEYYKAGDCYKALPLLEDLMSQYRMTDRGEDVYYYYAHTQYCLQEFYLASYYFKSFSRKFPSSPRAEECAFNAAMCKLENSPGYHLDQSETYKAIDEFQLFMNKYPNSSLVDSCNVLISGLRDKLETKSYEQAKQYFRMEQYRSAVISFNSTLEQFPDTDYKEEILFYIVKSNYLFAANSIEQKKEERFKETIKSYHTFVDFFASSSMLKEAENYYKSSLKELEKLKTNG